MADDKVSEFLGSDSNIAVVPCLPEGLTTVKDGKLVPSRGHSKNKLINKWIKLMTCTTSYKAIRQVRNLEAV